MSWEELYPICREQAYYAVLRYDSRRADKLQELISMSFLKYQRDLAAGKEIRPQEYKCFISQRIKELDFRSICPKGTGGTSSLDPLSYGNRRTTAPIAELIHATATTVKQVIRQLQELFVEYFVCA